LPLLCLSLTAVAASRPSVINWRIDADVQTILQRTGTPSATILIAEHGRIETCRFVDHLSDGIKDGDALARCWLERHLGVWIQDGGEVFPASARYD